MSGFLTEIEEKAEQARKLDLRAKQRTLKRWIRQLKISGVEFRINAPGSVSGFVNCVLDIHSSKEAYIFHTIGLSRYILLASIFEDDFGDTRGRDDVGTGSYISIEIIFIIDYVLKLTPEEIQKQGRYFDNKKSFCSHAYAKFHGSKK